MLFILKGQDQLAVATKPHSISLWLPIYRPGFHLPYLSCANTSQPWDHLSREDVVQDQEGIGGADVPEEAAQTFLEALQLGHAALEPTQALHEAIPR